MLHVVVAVMNNLPHLENLLAGLAEAAQVEPLRVVLIDNASNEEIPKALARFPNRGGIQVIYNQRNLGAAGAWNMGVRFAIANGAEKILVCGSDTCPYPGAIKKLSDHIAAGVPFVTGTAVPYMSMPGGAELADLPLIAAPDFSFFMLTPQVVEIVAMWDASVEYNVLKEMGGKRPEVLAAPWTWGLFDDRFWPAYFEDNDFHIRMHRAGVLAVRDQTALFRHDCSLTIRSHPEIGQMNQDTTFLRNLELYKAKYGGTPQEVGPQGARPLNVSDEEWARMSGGKPIMEVPREHVIEEAKKVYERYGG